MAIVLEPIQLSAPDLINPLRGLYRWRDQEYAPQPQPAFDAYQRYNWRLLEPKRGNYDFSAIDNDIAQAASEGRKYAFRVRAMVQGIALAVPDYLVDNRGWRGDTDADGVPDTYVPDWNDPRFLERVESLTAALGQRYNGDPRIAWVDVGIYGNWGEWHMWPFLDAYPRPNGTQEPSTASKQRIIDAMADAFSSSQLIMGSEDPEALVYALQTYPRMGWRRDSLGDAHFTDGAGWARLRKNPAYWQLVTERWKTAPIVTEFISPNDQVDPSVYQLAGTQATEYHVSLVSNGNTFAWRRLSDDGRMAMLALGKAVGYRYELRQLTLPDLLSPGTSIAIRAEWRNVGNAPTYEPWQVVYQLRSIPDGNVMWEAPSKLDLRTVLPPISSETAELPEATALPERAYIQDDTVALPTTIIPGTYELALVVRDLQGYRAPMALAIMGRTDTGAYFLGQLQVAP